MIDNTRVAKPNLCNGKSRDTVFHRFVLQKGDLYGKDNIGYYVFRNNCIGKSSNGKVYAMVYRLYNDHWVQVIYENPDKNWQDCFYAIVKYYGLYLSHNCAVKGDLRLQENYNKRKEERQERIDSAKELRQMAKGKGCVCRKHLKVSSARIPGLSEDYMEASREIYGDTVDMNGKKVKLTSTPMVCYMDGVFKK